MDIDNQATWRRERQILDAANGGAGPLFGQAFCADRGSEAAAVGGKRLSGGLPVVSPVLFSARALRRVRMTAFSYDRLRDRALHAEGRVRLALVTR